MRLLRYSIDVTLDACCDHRVTIPDEDLHRHALDNLNQADALLFGRATYPMMEAAWRQVGNAVRQLKREPGQELFVGGVKLPRALAEPAASWRRLGGPPLNNPYERTEDSRG